MTRSRFRGEDSVYFDFAPMVDVVLLLLIFFLLTTSFSAAERAVPLDLPGANTAVQGSPDLPVVSVDAEGGIFLAGEAVPLENLEATLRPLLENSGGLVGLRADEAGSYGDVVAVIDTIKAAGGQRLALGTRPTP